MMQKIPTTIITGFLGAGKTSLIQHLLNSAIGKKIALIINEFGEFGLDGTLLKGCGLSLCEEKSLLAKEDIIELSNGCICCTVADDFLPVMTKLLGRSDRLDHIIIETSGLALPAPLIEAFQWPIVKAQAAIDGVIAVIDSEALARGQFASNELLIAKQRASDPSLDHQTPLEHLFLDQINSADLLILNKVDLISGESLKFVEAFLLSKRGAKIPQIKCSFGHIDAKWLLGLGAHIKDSKAQPSLKPLSEHNHDEFFAHNFKVPILENREAFEAKLTALLEKTPPLRLKGFVRIKDKAMPLVIQAVGRRLESYYAPLDLPSEVSESQLVLIAEAGFEVDSFETVFKA